MHDLATEILALTIDDNVVHGYSYNNKEKTDNRRGEGVYDRVMQSMKNLHDNGLIFGVSVTVTTENMEEVYSEDFISKLSELGCKAVIFVEFVPVTDEASHLAPGEPERIVMADNIARLRKEHEEMVFIAFPGDEKSSGGCTLFANREQVEAILAE